MKRILSRRGETLVETLCALLVATLVLLFLATAVVSSYRLNASVQEADVSFHYTREDGQEKSVTISDRDGFSRQNVTVTEYTDGNDYHYYTYQG